MFLFSSNKLLIKKRISYMATYEMEGIVEKIMDEQTFASGSSKRNLILKTDGDRYPQDVQFEFWKNNTKFLEDLTPGTRVKVSFDIRGREYDGRYFVSLNAWKLENLDAAPTPAAPATPVSDVFTEDVSLDENEDFPY